MKMKTYLRSTFLVVIIVLTSGVSIAQKFSKTHWQVLKNQAAEIALSYNNLLQTISDLETSDFKKIELTKEWFGYKNVMLDNIIAPDDSSKLYSITKYIDVIRKSYPSGIILKAELNENEEIKPGKIEKQKKRLFFYIPIKVNIIGIYKGKKIIKNTYNISLLYSFSKKGKKRLNKFELEDIRSDKNLLPLVNYTYHSLELQFGFDIASEIAFFDEYRVLLIRNEIPRFGVSYYKSFNKFLGLNLGFFMNQASLSYELKTEHNFYYTQHGLVTTPELPIEYINRAISYDIEYDEQDNPHRIFNYDNELYQDKDGDYMLPYVTLNGLKDERIIKFFTLPINLEIKYERPTGFTFYILAGIQILYKYQTNIKASGAYSVQAYYPEYDFNLYNLPDYGYTSDTLDNSYDFKNKKMSHAFDIGIGIKFNIYKKIGVNLQFMANMFDDRNFYSVNPGQLEHKFSPQYTAQQFLNEELKVSPRAYNTSLWHSNYKPDNVTFSDYTFNVGIFYKF